MADTHPARPYRPLVLVAEDDEHSAALLRFHLERAGFQALTATDARQAIQQLDQHPTVVLVVLAPGLPLESSLQVVKHLRAPRRAGRTPILLLGARLDAQDLLPLLDAGADDYLLKPFEPAELVARVQRLAKQAPSG